MPTSSLRLAQGTDLRDRTAGWLATTCEGWSLPTHLARTWLPALDQGLTDRAAADVAPAYDDDLGLVSVEVRDGGGRVLVGLDDFIGAA